MEAWIKCTFNMAHNALESSHVLHDRITNKDANLFINIRSIRPFESNDKQNNDAHNDANNSDNDAHNYA